MMRTTRKRNDVDADDESVAGMIVARKRKCPSTMKWKMISRAEAVTKTRTKTSGGGGGVGADDGEGAGATAPMTKTKAMTMTPSVKKGGVRMCTEAEQPSYPSMLRCVRYTYTRITFLPSRGDASGPCWHFSHQKQPAPPLPCETGRCSFHACSLVRTGVSQPTPGHTWAAGQ